MAEQFRALFVILFLAAPAYVLTRMTLARVVGAVHFQRRWAAWLALTIVLFAAQNKWLYVFGAAAVLWLFMRHEPNPVALFVMLVLAAPPMSIGIPGFGIVNFFAELTPARVLALVVLLPSAIRLSRDGRSARLGSTGIDRVVLAFVAYVTLMQLRETTLTDTLRTAAYAVTDTLLIYFVASRTLTTRTAIREVAATVVIIAVPIAFFALFETAKSWLLYGAIPDTLGAPIMVISGYLMREGLLRATVTAGHSLTLGCFFSIAIGMLMFVSGFVHSRAHRVALYAVLALGLLSSLARGPWLATLCIYLIHGALMRDGVLTVARRGLALAALFLALMITPFGARIIDLLPYIGTAETFNVQYRERLVAAGLVLFERNPITGSVTYLDTPEMRDMIQGQGIVDMVNSYLAMALQYGAIGLALFALPFLLALKNAWSSIRNTTVAQETRVLAMVLFATLTGFLLMIYAVSFIAIVPIFAWLITGMTCALPGAVAAQRAAVPTGGLSRSGGT